MTTAFGDHVSESLDKIQHLQGSCRCGWREVGSYIPGSEGGLVAERQKLLNHHAREHPTCRRPPTIT